MALIPALDFPYKKPECREAVSPLGGQAVSHGLSGLLRERRAAALHLSLLVTRKALRHTEGMGRASGGRPSVQSGHKLLCVAATLATRVARVRGPQLAVFMGNLAGFPRRGKGFQGPPMPRVVRAHGYP